jgi:hypothetical protein
VAQTPDIERRGLHRDQHQVAGQNGGPAEHAGARRAVDQRDVIIGGNVGQLAMQQGGGHADDGKQRRRLAGARPGQRAGLRIGIDDKDLDAGPGVEGGKVQADGGLANAALLVEHAQDHRSPLIQITALRCIANAVMPPSDHCVTANRKHGDTAIR